MQEAQTIITKGLLKKYKEWYNLNTEEAISFILSNPLYFACAFMAIYYTAELILSFLSVKEQPKK